MKVALDTLGCKLNQAETELLARQLAVSGYRLVSQIDEADIYILNTCSVTHTADAKSRHLLRLAHRRNPRALVVATGCYAQRAPEDLAQIEGVSLVLGNDEKQYLWQLLEKHCYPGEPDEKGLPESWPAAFRTRTLIKIQDGCNNFCAYCIVPLVRDREKSLPVKEILTEVRQRVASGAREIVLTGTKVGAYHDDGINLKDLLERILAETNGTRIRLSSLQPQEISSELIELWQDKRLCPHFHLPLQSGSDGVLQRMRRRYSVGDYQKAVSLIRSMVPTAAITTDIIVGFPGETEAEFEQSYRLCQQLGFARIHVFPYSPREGTLACQLPHQISEPLKKHRRQKMLALAEETARDFSQQFSGRVMPVLWERQSAGVWSGLTDNYIKVYTKSDDDLTNKLSLVEVLEIKNDEMWGEVVI